MLNNRKRIVIVGATSSIAEHCARLWVTRESVEVILVGRDENKLQRLSEDLCVRNSNTSVKIVTTSFIDPQSVQTCVDTIAAQGTIDAVLIAHGSLPDQSSCEQNLVLCENSLIINGISPVMFAEAFIGKMLKNKHGTLGIIGSVAGDRGRKSNYVYGAAKGMVTRYAQGLQHRLAGSGVNVVLIKPGPTDTPMTAHLKQQGTKLAEVTEVAAAIVKAMDQGSSVAYIPGKWALIMMVIRHLPNVIFNKLNI